MARHLSHRGLTVSNTYGEWLKAQREAAGLTQQELAEAAITTRSHIAHIEAGRRIPSKEDARRLDKALNTGNVLGSFLPQQDVAVADYFETARQLETAGDDDPRIRIVVRAGHPPDRGVARAVLRVGFPPRSEEECDRLVVTRLERAKILNDPLTPVV